MRTRHSHTECNHANTKTARAACRRARDAADTDRVVTEAFNFVRKARLEGYSNTIKEVTFYEVAQTHGIGIFNLDLAKRMARERAAVLNEVEILDPEIRIAKDIK